jgi:predicted exporter/SAM-dependent methyltransferase
MTTPRGKTRYLLALALLAGVGLAFWWGVNRLTVNNDIVATLPRDDKVVLAAEEILRHHPVLHNIFIQISASDGPAAREDLVKAADLASTLLTESGLVRVVSSGSAAGTFAILLGTVTDNLPFFLSETDLKTRVEPLLEPGRVEALLEDGLRQLLDLGSIGQAGYFAKDPLGLRNLFLGQLSSSLPFHEAELEQGHIMSKDGRHLLLMARPARPNQDSTFARLLTEVMERISAGLNEFSARQGRRLTMDYVGAFRASLDNEEIIKSDTSRAITLVMLSLVPLVLLSFRRPWLGLLSAIPATAGTMLAVFVYALTGEAIFGVAMGFGGALIGIAVDHGLAYVILLDRPGGTMAHDVSKDVWAVGSLPLLAAMAALLSLAAIGIPLFAQVGIFAALGVGISAVFAHLFFPLVLPRIEASKREKPLPLERFMDWIIRRSGRWSVWACLTFALAMLFVAKLEFNVDLASMNTLSKETLEAEQALQKAWGDLSAKPSLMVRGSTAEELLTQVDRLALFLNRERHSSVLGEELPRTMLLPGPETQGKNRKAWVDFWSQERILRLDKSLKETSVKLGFKPDAFEPFLRTLHQPVECPSPFSQEFLAAFGVFPEGAKGGWALVDTLMPGANYDPSRFFERARQQGFLFFDARHFSSHLAGEMHRSFVGILLMVMVVTVACLFLVFLDWQLLLLSIAPVSFSLIATLGTMGLLGHSLSIPSLMLAPLLVGLGLESGVYFVRSYQRFGTAPNPRSDGFRVTVMLCGLTTLVGFGSLLFAQHAVLRDAGISTFFGIFYSMAGAFWMVPPLLRLVYSARPAPPPPAAAGSKEHTRSTLRRYRHLEAFPRLFARFKILLDPMFPRLADFVKPGWKVVDIGCGYGVPAAWLLTLYPDLEFSACDPTAERARIAARVLGDKAKVANVGALDLAPDHGQADAVLLLDVLHYLQDKEVVELLGRLNASLSPEGRLIIRLTLPGTRFSLFRFVEETRLRVQGTEPCWRSRERVLEILGNAGFKVDLVEPTAPGREETWFIGVRRP